MRLPQATGVGVERTELTSIANAADAALFDLFLAPSLRVNDANGDSRLAVLPDRVGKRRSVRAGGGVWIIGWNATAAEP